ncbi:hypothetical protein KH5H1_28530 [Corallococcus caeni]|uniref:hypothetical protein n=1 Tax=Corallococcus caeni TaxID=3082388 RepID=UPI002958079C|nr:hypothetical protein KH5H1_28530 [Corallococcus sp. KH5-1]
MSSESKPDLRKPGLEGQLALDVGGGGWAQFLVMPTSFVGAACFIAGLTGLLTGAHGTARPFG